ncbi:MAG: hypothetical protein VXV96_01610 [Bdellovibrionota bacterium]|jgi:hypothetical protein|nr:hypothetical protein [Bdellovibrionota bacterium]
MKNLFLAMMAILLINVSYAGEEMGESMKADCVDSIQSSRFQETVDNTASVDKAEENNEGASAK